MHSLTALSPADDVSLEARYPTGSLWILNRVSSTFARTENMELTDLQAKILRMTGDPTGAIKHLLDGLKPDHKSFAQADTLVSGSRRF